MNSRRLARRTGAATGPRLVRGCSAAGELVHECSAAGEHTAAGDLQPTQQRDRNDACLRCTSRYLHCALSLPSLQACNRTWLAACLLFLLACHGIPSVLPDASFRGSAAKHARLAVICAPRSLNIAEYCIRSHCYDKYRGYPCTSLQLCHLLSQELRIGAVQRQLKSKGPKNKNSSAAAAYRRGAREQVSPRATDRPPA